MLAVSEPVAWLIGIGAGGVVVAIVYSILSPSWKWANELSAKFDQEMKIEDSFVNLIKIQAEVLSLREIIPECHDSQYTELVKHHDALVDQFNAIWNNVRYYSNAKFLKTIARNAGQTLRGGFWKYENFLHYGQSAKNAV